MNDITKFTPHEALELHELLNAGVLDVKKLNATIGIVQDEELKQFMQTTLNTKKASVNDIQATVSKIQNL
jgi:hypothetical protein